MKTTLWLLTALTIPLVLSPHTIWAHPTSAQGTLSVMGENTEDTSQFDVSYSYKYWLGLGARYHELRESNSKVESTLGTLGLLVYRSNGESHQGNVYLTGGAGHAWFKDSSDKTLNDDFVYSLGAQADYETRKIYTLIKYENIKTQNENISEYYQARAGFAPYVAGFYDLNTWFILQASMDRAMSSSVELAPIIRFFYRNVLTEFGATTDGKFIFNFMVHY